MSGRAASLQTVIADRANSTLGVATRPVEFTGSPSRRVPMPPSNESHANPPPVIGRESALLEAARLAREWIIESSARPGALRVSTTLQRQNSAIGQYT